MKIAVDAMGGDNAPAVVVEGVERARDRFKDIEFDLFGDPQQVRPLIKDATRINLIETTEMIEMGEEPVRAIRKRILRSSGRPSPLRKAKPTPSFRPATLGPF